MKKWEKLSQRVKVSPSEAETETKKELELLDWKRLAEVLGSEDVWRGKWRWRKEKGLGLEESWRDGKETPSQEERRTPLQ